jgi:uncharacterized membrane protein
MKTAGKILNRAKKTNDIERFWVSLFLLCSLSLALLLIRFIDTDSLRYNFLIWNLALATVPLSLAYILTQRIKEDGWIQWPQIFLSALFLVFLPNSFYLVTDLVHLRETYETSLIYDAIMLTSFMFSGLALGYSAIYLVHKQLQKRLGHLNAAFCVGVVFLAVSFAIYLGRFSRWNTWDILLQPAGLLFDVSDRFINPAVHSDTYMVTIIIFLVTSVLYGVVYSALVAAKTK